ncbi:MAG: hypothetical protein U5M50_08790 [Sphingobium sp.]|nr:hypothetical protein [Sphingobium sp.]
MRRRDPAWAFGLGGIQKGPWRPTYEEACQDAMGADFATRDEATGTFYLHVLAEIWTTTDLVEVFPRALFAAKENGPTSASQLTRIERIIARREAQNSAEAA